MFKAMEAVKLVRVCRSLAVIAETNVIALHHSHVRGWNPAIERRGMHSSSITEDGSVVYLRNGENGAEVYLVGTCHVSKKSAQQVKQVIGFVKPNVIAVELCKRRAQSLQHLKSSQRSLLQLVLDSWKVPGGLLKKLVRLYLGLQYHHLRVVGFEPGKEFKVALEECKRMEAQLLLIDDDIGVTVGKLVDALSFSVVLRLFKAGKRLEEMVGNVALEDAIERFSERGFARKVMEIMTIECPEIMEVLITHRDQVMFKHLRSCQGKVVGVVGMGHMDGIEKMWKDADQKALNDNT